MHSKNDMCELSRPLPGGADNISFVTQQQHVCSSRHTNHPKYDLQSDKCFHGVFVQKDADCEVLRARNPQSEDPPEPGTFGSSWLQVVNDFRKLQQPRFGLIHQVLSPVTSYYYTARIGTGRYMIARSHIMRVFQRGKHFVGACSHHPSPPVSYLLQQVQNTMPSRRPRDVCRGGALLHAAVSR